METEATNVVPGVIRVQDVRRALGTEFSKVEPFTVLVLGNIDTGSSVATIRLGWMAAGRGEHRVLLCPRCVLGRAVLHADGRGALACISCLKKRTRRQQERHCRDFRRLGGREEDRLLRLVAKGSVTRAGVEVGRRLAEELVRGDQARVTVLLQQVQSALGSVRE